MAIRRWAAEIVGGRGGWYTVGVIRPMAMIAVLAAVTLSLTGCGGSQTDSPTSTVSHSTTTTGGSNSNTVPQSTSTAPTTAWTTASAASVMCRNGQVAVTLLGNGAAAGSVGQVIGFVNVGKTACTLTGYPGVAALDARGTQVVQAQRELNGMLGGLENGAATPPVVTLEPGKTASAMVEGTDNPVGTDTSCTYYPSLLVTPPNLTRPMKVTVTLSGSIFPGFPGCSGIRVNPVVPGSNGRLG